jgi:diguanylate cyclase (GGDEF)-like protein/PAS domain S-box-containing protein
MIRRPTLLVVDDNEYNRDVLSRRLGLKGYAVDVATGGGDALSRLAAGPYDLILLDVEMPGMSGFEVLSRIRGRHSSTQLPVIMVTARADGSDIVEAFRLGANDYVTKPIDFPVALARIETQLSLKRAVEDLRESEERYALALQGANDGLWDWNLITNEVHWSARWKAMFGHDDAAIGTSPEEWLTRVHRDDLAGVKQALHDHLDRAADHFESEHRVLHQNGTFRWVLCRGAAIRNREGIATRCAGSFTDITESKVSDPLTGLPNRLLFVDLLDRSIKRTERRPTYAFALLVLGLDRFGTIRDSLGPVAVDRLVVAVAHRLQSCLRCTDALTSNAADLTLARIAGDEFTVLVDDVGGASGAVRVAERLREALEKPFTVDGHQVFVSATVGIAVSTSGYHSPEEIIRDAITALHRAQADPTSNCELFDPAMRIKAVTRLQLETDLRNGIENDAFVVYYQPIVSLATGRIDEFEALVRWRHPTRGLLAPAAFIDVAEETGMIVQIGRVILEKSCRQMVMWQRQFGGDAPRLICVNISSRQFVDSDLAREVEAILNLTGLPPSSLKLEITESAFMGDIPGAQVTLNRLQTLGVCWSLDDFGTGYSSLNHLHQLRVETVKIDRSFVNRIGFDASGSAMVRAIVALAHSLSMDVVAEGVETAEQCDHLRALGCEFTQGFFFSQPVDAPAASGLLTSQPWCMPAVQVEPEDWDQPHRMDVPHGRPDTPDR